MRNMSKIFECSSNGTAQNGIGRRSTVPCPAGETELSIILLRVVFVCRTGPQFQSALNASCSYLQVLGSPTCPCKLLKTLVIHTLKRLASAVQLRPWPPHS